VSCWERWSLNILSTVVIVTGVVYFWMKHLVELDDPFSVISHPLQPFMLDLHILAAPLLILILGITFTSHIAKKIRSHFTTNRRTGLIVLFCFLPMVFSGYLLQVLANPVAIQIALVVHLLTGGIFAVSYGVHLVINFRLQRARPKSQEENRLAA
jgi:uncharacterized membrane protein YidH (DUF202 family)